MHPSSRSSVDRRQRHSCRTCSQRRREPRCRNTGPSANVAALTSASARTIAEMSITSCNDDVPVSGGLAPERKAFRCSIRNVSVAVEATYRSIHRPVSHFQRWPEQC
jgi:hypothetical protein